MLVYMKYIKYIVQIAIGLLLSFVVMCGQGLFGAGSVADKMRAVCDGFSVTALLFLSVGTLLWASSTGFFDALAYAARKGAHALVPGLVHDGLGGFYEYRQERQRERKPKGGNAMLLAGAGFLAASLALTAAWYLWV